MVLFAMTAHKSEDRELGLSLFINNITQHIKHAVYLLFRKVVIHMKLHTKITKLLFGQK